MGGGAGHAGLFSTADDLAVFCRMLLNGGAFGQTRILAPSTIDTMLSPSTPLEGGYIRALGWALDLTDADGSGKCSAPPIDHSGFTGTKLWLLPGCGIYIVFLSSRLHPDGQGDVFDLRENIITIAASVAAGQAEPAAPAERNPAASVQQPNSAPEKTRSRGQVLSGLDVLRAEDFSRVRGKESAC